MSGFEVVGVVLGMWPVVAGAVTACKAMKNGRSAASLKRKLKTEEVIFHEFVRNLLASEVSDAEIQQLIALGLSADLELWKDRNLEAKLCDKLGRSKAENMLEIVRDIGKLLQDLDGELSKMSPSSGTEFIGVIKTGLRNAKANLSQGHFLNRLTQLHGLNEDLARLLKSRTLSPSLERNESSRPSHAQFLHRDYAEAKELYDAIRQSYVCQCDEPHATILGFHCPQCVPPYDSSRPTDHEHHWTFELVLQDKSNPGLARSISFTPKEDPAVDLVTETSPPEPNSTSNPNDQEDLCQSEVPGGESLHPPPPRERRRSVSISLESHAAQEEGVPIVQDLCSFASSVHEKRKSSNVLGVIGKTSSYKMCVNQSDAPQSGDIICLEDLLSAQRRGSLLRRERMVLAFRLSAAVLQFCLTPWIDDSWSWKNFCLPGVEGNEGEISQLLVQRMFYSAHNLRHSADSARSQPRTVLSFGEPILTRLGFALIELAVGSTLQEMRDGELKSPTAVEQNIDKDSLDLLTSFELLESGRIARMESQGYEDVVRACLKHQYKERGNAGVKALDSTHPSFFDSVEESIILPLYDGCCNSWVGV